MLSFNRKGTLSQGYTYVMIINKDMNNSREREPVSAEHSAKSRSIGYLKEMSPTLRARITPAVIISYTPILSEVSVQETIKASAVSMWKKENW